jgi:hypothetical protein
MIDARRPLVLIVGLGSGPPEVVGRTLGRGLRIALEEGQRHGIDARGRDRPARKRRASRAARRRVVNDRHPAANRLAEDPLPLQRRRHGREHRAPDRLTLTLVVDEEECLVPADRTADDATELVAAKLRLGAARREQVPGVERLVAEELEHRAAEGIGPGLGRQVDHATVEPSELRRRAVGLELELLNRVDGREIGDLSRLGLKDRDAIEEVLIGARTAAIDARQLRRRRQRHSGSERRQGDERPPVEWERRDLLLRDDLTQACRRALHGRVGGHGDAFTHRTHHQLHVQPDGLARLEAYALPAYRAEAAQFDLDAVFARCQTGDRIAARVVGERLPRRAGPQMYRDDRGPRHACARRVRDRSGYLRTTDLAAGTSLSHQTQTGCAHDTPPSRRHRRPPDAMHSISDLTVYQIGLNRLFTYVV